MGKEEEEEEEEKAGDGGPVAGSGCVQNWGGKIGLVERQGGKERQGQLWKGQNFKGNFDITQPFKWEG